jgi:hypothetical protein
VDNSNRDSRLPLGTQTGAAQAEVVGRAIDDVRFWQTAALAFATFAAGLIGSLLARLLAMFLSEENSICQGPAGDRQKNYV